MLDGGQLPLAPGLEPSGHVGVVVGGCSLDGGAIKLGSEVFLPPVVSLTHIF